jgi:UDP-GlcNAc:undecaprenyl-phosphate/decaprenyl-phosphate GlcNAc-1-phosphate transferase
MFISLLKSLFKTYLPRGLLIFIIPTLFFTSFFATYFFIIILFSYALKIGFFDVPDQRKQHAAPTPPIGGIAIFLAILTTLPFTHLSLQHQIAYLSAVALLVSVGVIDDRKGLSVKVRLLAEIASGLIMTEMAGIKITVLGNLIGFGDINLGIFSTPFTIFAVVGSVNAFNMIDGLDGLASGTALIAVITIALISWHTQHWLLLYFCVIFVGAIIAFLLFNLPILGRKRGQIFLGDSGSTMLGFSVCWLVISISQGQVNNFTPSTVLWIIALPLFDSICIMSRRIMRGQSPFKPDREHLHHVLVQEGYSTNQTLVILLMFSVLLAVTGVSASIYFGASEYLLFLLWLLIFACYYWAINKRIKDRRKTYISIKFEDRRKTPDRRAKANKGNIATQK